MSRKKVSKMKLFLTLSAVILAASAMPADLGKEGDIGYVPDVIYNAANFTNGRVPAGQAGFATVNGGTFGGNGGAVWTVWDPWALRDAITPNDRRIVYVRGRIDLTPLFAGSPGIGIRMGGTKTIIGGDGNAMIFGGGLRLVGISQVIIQNIKFHNALSYAPGEQPNGNGGIISMAPGEFSEIDAIDIETSTNIWIDHCEFADDPWITPTLAANMRRHDGLIDIKRAANWISVSNNIFRNHNHVMLVGHNDNNAAQDNGRLKVTFYLNWFQGTVQRNPRVRYGEVHILNNLYTDITLGYGAGVGAGARIYFERNSCVNSRRCWGFASGVPNPAGHLLALNNRIANSAFDTGIPSNLVTWRPANHYGYSAMSENNVETHVRRYAGTW